MDALGFKKIKLKKMDMKSEDQCMYGNPGGNWMGLDLMFYCIHIQNFQVLKQKRNIQSTLALYQILNTCFVGDCLSLL